MLSEAKVYVEYLNGEIYYHSNFRSTANSGEISKYATKIAGYIDSDAIARRANASSPFAARGSHADEEFNVPKAQKEAEALKSVKFVLGKIIIWGEPNPDRTLKATKAIEEVPFMVDISVFDQDGIPRVDLSGIKNITIVDGAKHVSLISDVSPLTTAKPPPSIIAKIKGCCLYGRPPHETKKMAALLETAKFDKSNLKIASLFIESATEHQLKTSGPLKKAVIRSSARSLHTEADIRKIFEEAKGTTLVLLGHVENSDYVILGSGDSTQLRIPIARVRQMAKENNVSLIDIGCETVKAIKSSNFGFGVMTRYRSTDAVKALERAVMQSNTLGDFLVHIASTDLRVVIEPSFLQSESRSVTVFEKIRRKGQEIWTRVARITFSFIK